MASPKKQNSTQVPNGGYSLSGYGAVPPVYGNITIPNGGLTYSTATTAVWTSPSPRVKITDSDIEIDGLSLKTTLQTLQERLAIMQVNPALEQEFDELRACANEYRRLEKKFEEQKRMWDTLKKEHK
jgi:hypothetical protein